MQKKKGAFMDILTSVLGLVLGLALFLYGMDLMGDSLKRAQAQVLSKYSVR